MTHSFLFLKKMTSEKIRNLLLVGFTYSGKSTLANVLSGTDNFSERESVWKNSAEAENFQKQEFEWKGMRYRVIDATILPTRIKIAEFMPEGISRVLFVVDKPLTAEEIEEQALKNFDIVFKQK